MITRRTTLTRDALFFRQFAKQGYANATKAIQTVSPHLSYHSARETASRILARVDRNGDIVAELAKIMSADEVKSLFTDFARNPDKPDAIRLKAGELMGKVHAILTERNENYNKNMDLPALDLTKTDTQELTSELVRRLKLSSQGVNTQETPKEPSKEAAEQADATQVNP